MTRKKIQSPEIVCGRCHRRASASGSALRFVLGLHRRVCTGCRQEIDKGREVIKPKPKARLVGASGKAQVVPTQKQAGWSVSRVEPTPVQCPATVDYRYSVDPATFKGGEFTRLGVGRYVE